MSVRVCPKCRALASPDSRVCAECGWEFIGDEQVTTHAPPPVPQIVDAPRKHSTARMWVGILGLLLILGAGLERCTTVTLNRTASAVQITQIYTEGAFFVIVIVGAVVAFYVAIRPD